MANSTSTTRSGSAPAADEPSLRSWALKAPLLAMLLVLVLGVTAAWALARGAEAGSLRWEGAKMCMQVGVVSVAGALLAFVAEHYRRAQDELRFRAEFLNDVMKRITSSYNKAKGARRMARAKGLVHTPPTHVRRAAYDTFMTALNDAQLELEAVKHDLKTSSKLVASDAATRLCVKEMEKRLNRVVDEYQDERPKAAGADNTELPLEGLGRFVAFVHQESNSDFQAFAKLHRDARTAINQKLLVLASGRKVVGKLERPSDNRPSPPTAAAPRPSDAAATKGAR